MMLQIEFTMSKKDSDDKSVFVKSGLKKRYKKGFPNSRAPIGFINDKSKEKGDRGWLIDKENFSKLKLLFKRFLQGTDSISSITEYAQNELVLTTRQTKRQGHKPVGRSLVYHIICDPIYAGLFYSLNEDGIARTKRKLCPSLPRIITEDEHRKILNILSLKTSPKTQTHDRPYLGFIRGVEGNYIGVDVKSQVICDCKKKFAYRNREQCPQCNAYINQLKSPKYLEYILYYNVKRRKAKNLITKTISEKKIDEFLINYIRNEISIPPTIAEWSKIHITELNNTEFSQNQKKARTQEQRNTSINEEKRKLRSMFRKGMISEQEYLEDLKELESETIETTEIIHVTDWREKLHEIIDLGKELADIIENGSVSAKKEALALLGSNLVWNEENLSIHNDLWLKAFIKGRKPILSKYQGFEPEKNVVNKGQNTPFGVPRLTMLDWLDDVRKTYYQEYYKELRPGKTFIILFI